MLTESADIYLLGISIASSLGPFPDNQLLCLDSQLSHVSPKFNLVFKRMNRDTLLPFISVALLCNHFDFFLGNKKRASRMTAQYMYQSII